MLSSGASVGLFFQSQLMSDEKLRFTFRTAVFDSGALQPHAFTVDMQASLKEYYQRADGDHREGRIQVNLFTSVLYPAVGVTCARQALSWINYYSGRNLFDFFYRI